MNDMSQQIERLGDHLRAQRVPLDEIPVIDLDPMKTGIGKDDLARNVHSALANIGFMYIRNHGVPAHLVDAAYRVSAQFFELPQHQKDALHIDQSGMALHGYTPLFGENNDPGRTVDFKEIFDLGREASDGQVKPFFGPTPWPSALPEFRSVMEDYHRHMLDLARRVMAAMALSLDLPEDYFRQFMREPIGIQRLLHYPPQEAAKDDSLIGIGAHTDYGCLTILSQDNVGGLQVMNRDGVWIDAPPIPGTFIVNIGDILQRLTNGVYLANLHRVINVSGKERYSIPCFFDLDFDTLVAPLPSCVSVERPSAYTPVKCGVHKWKRYQAAYPHLSDQKVD